MLSLINYCRPGCITHDSQKILMDLTGGLDLLYSSLPILFSTELFIQFGYVYLFSSVYPLAASWAIFNNVLEIRADAFKLCKVYRRPIAKRTKDIGAWQIAFEVMGAIAIMTNCGLLCLSPELRSIAPTLTPAEWLLLFVVIEHSLLGLTLALRQLIPDVPYKIKMAMARLEYESRQALKNEVQSIYQFTSITKY